MSSIEIRTDAAGVLAPFAIVAMEAEGQSNFHSATMKSIPIRQAEPQFDFDHCGNCLQLQEAHHRIANHFALLSGYVHLRASAIGRQAVAPDRASVLLLLESIETQIRTVAQVHRLMATAGKDARIDIGIHLHEVLKPFTSGIFGDIKLKEELAAGCLTRTEHILSISQIVSEVVTNAIKHGRPGDVAVVVRCQKAARNSLLLEIVDNGPGLPGGFDPAASKSVGLRLLKALAHQLGALAEFKSSPKGLRFRLLLQPVSFV